MAAQVIVGRAQLTVLGTLHSKHSSVRLGSSSHEHKWLPLIALGILDAILELYVPDRPYDKTPTQNVCHQNSYLQHKSACGYKVMHDTDASLPVHLSSGSLRFYPTHCRVVPSVVLTYRSMVLYARYFGWKRLPQSTSRHYFDI